MSDFIPEGWKFFKIRDVANPTDKYSFTGGPFGSDLKSEDYTESGVRIIQLQNIGDGQFKNKYKIYTSEAKADSLHTCNIYPNDIILSKMGDPVARATIIPTLSPRYVMASDGIRLSVNKDKFDIKFVHDTINAEAFRAQAELNSTGSTRKRIGLTQLRELTFISPPLREQQKIAAILTSVDEVIEKTQAQCDKLKDLKTAMMQTLLTKGVGIDGNPHTEFKDSPVGRIPKGWEALALSKIAKLERGKFSHRPRNDPSFYNGDIPFLQTGNIPKKSPYIKSYSQTLNAKGLGVSKLFPIGTLVITIAATIGEIGILEFDSCFPDSLVGIKVNSKKADSMFILYVMRHLKEELDLLAPQTAQKNINLDILNPFVIPVPPLEEQKKISKTLESVDWRLGVLESKLVKINNTKKALMQDLLTGKVRVTAPTPPSTKAP